MLKQLFAGALLVAGLAQATPASAQFTAAAPLASPPGTTKNDYADDKTWLCRPGRQDACAIDHTTTVVAADGKLTTRNVDGRSERADRLLLRLSDDLHRPDAEQRHERRPGGAQRHPQQFARFASKCRVVRAALPSGHAGRAHARARAGRTPVPLDQRPAATTM